MCCVALIDKEPAIWWYCTVQAGYDIADIGVDESNQSINPSLSYYDTVVRYITMYRYEYCRPAGGVEEYCKTV